MRRPVLAALAVLLVLPAACGSVQRPGAAVGPTPSAPAAPLTQPELRYRLVDHLGPPVYCDMLQYPVARVDDPAYVAQLVATLRTTNPQEFDAIVAHEHLDGAHLAAMDNTRILGQESALSAIALTPRGTAYTFAYELMGPPTVEVTGTIDSQGAFSVARRSPAPRRPCPV